MLVLVEQIEHFLRVIGRFLPLHKNSCGAVRPRVNAAVA